MTTSILKKEYVEPDRPYSQRELQYNRDKVHKTLRIGSVRAHHKKCDHFYYVKKNGRKENDIKEANSRDVGNCSVCWKFHRTPMELKSEALGLINSYCKRFFTEPSYLTYDDVDIESIFLTWLYDENY